MKIDKRYTWGGPSKLFQSITAWQRWDSNAVRFPAILLMLLFASWAVVMPLDGGEQLVFGLGVYLLAIYLRRYTGSFITLVLISLSVVVSTRYLYWRATETLNTTTWLNALFSVGLLLSEMYAWLVLALGYFQTIWPLNRQSTPLPPNQNLWPTVDVLIPTYNEPLDVVKMTAMAAAQIDWPADKLKIYILDDGKRDEFRDFANKIGVNYITRDDNRNAKAGNLNNALKQISGEYVAIFDCDHIPTRSFLQVSMGGFLADPKLALVQTPHHFLSPDPFERNLGTFREVPNEGALFYGLVQDGNDLWNATFFCGSCAIIKRAPLDEVGGIATETVTEDAHTSLKLHRLGYNSAYLNIIQAAGLATETLSGHVKQRMRWARGMVQIFRTDCPLFGKGLTWAQRFCYSNAIFHFMYGFPRMFFLLSPLAYLFFGSYIINAPAGVIAVYALPHLALSFMANSRMQGRYRHSFWNEAYETSLAWYIMWPALFAMVNPKAGKFNVTAKGGRIEQEFFDWQIGRPYVVFFILLVCGFIIGFIRMFWFNAHEWDTALINICWTAYNLIMVSATIAVAMETRQIRKGWRVEREIPAAVVLPSGQVVDCRTRDYSEGGISLVLPSTVALKPQDNITLLLFRREVEYKFPAEVVGLHNTLLRVRFNNLTLEQERDLVAATLSRADAWLNWLKDREEVDHPLRGIKEILHYSWLGVTRLLSSAHKGV
ncbi:MAG: UDP-forming cellulose synthase catalytic subunit [Gallionellaceae bacterium]|nr:UDP-forming cellulose synthase catalytic subunit [Gallionellaceae bacterium]